MKKLIITLFFFSSLSLNAQEFSSYTDLLNVTPEVPLSDSLLLNAVDIKTNSLDTFTIKKWFSIPLSINNTNRLKNRDYYLTGKITHNSNFDLLVIVEEKKRTDRSGIQVVYLVSIKKDGSYISSLEVAVSGLKNNSNYNTSSKLYANNRLKLNTKFNVNDSLYADVITYKINQSGRFLLAPKY